MALIASVDTLPVSVFTVASGGALRIAGAGGNPAGACYGGRVCPGQYWGFDADLVFVRACGGSITDWIRGFITA
jgi:hypothetical protein